MCQLNASIERRNLSRISRNSSRCRKSLQSDQASAQGKTFNTYGNSASRTVFGSKVRLIN